MNDIKFLYDTDILIWVERGNKKAISLIENAEHRFISIQTYLELFQGARSKQEQHAIKSFIIEADFTIYPFTENIGHRAIIYIEEYALSHGLRAGDAIIAATANENNCILVTGNKKHYHAIQELKLNIFHPS